MGIRENIGLADIVVKHGITIDQFKAQGNDEFLRANTGW